MEQRALHPPHPHTRAPDKGAGHPSPSFPQRAIPSALSPLGPPFGDFLSLQGSLGTSRGCVPPGRWAGRGRAGRRPPRPLPAPTGPGPAPAPALLCNQFGGPPVPSRPAPHPHPAEHVLPGWGLGPLPPRFPTPTGNIPETFFKLGGRPRRLPTPPPSVLRVFLEPPSPPACPVRRGLGRGLG